jgi:hypothetical protein
MNSPTSLWAEQGTCRQSFYFHLSSPSTTVNVALDWEICEALDDPLDKSYRIEKLARAFKSRSSTYFHQFKP